MKKVVLYLIYILLFFLCFLFTGYSKDDYLLPPIDSETMIMGLRHTESLIVSGMGRLHFCLFSQENKITDEFNAFFAFDSYRTYYHYQSGTIKGTKGILNKKLQLRFTMVINEKGEISYLGVQHTEEEPMPVDEDPRNWGLWFYGIPLSQYLQEHKVQIVDTENLEIENLAKAPCYVLKINNSSSSPTSDVRLWIRPDEGFRCVQVQTTAKSRYGKQQWKKQFIYKVYKVNGQIIWFLKKGVFWMFSYPDNQLIAKIVMEVEDFHPNADISNLFHLEIDPETLVWDETLSKLRPFKELGWK